MTFRWAKQTLYLSAGFVLAGLILAVAVLLVGRTNAAYLPEPGVYDLSGENASRKSLVPPGATGSIDLTIGDHRINNFSLSDISIGAPGIDPVFQITTTGGATIYIDTMTADGMTCPFFTISDSEIHTAVYQDNVADGNAFAVAGSLASDVGVSSVRGAQEYVFTGDTYDKVLITADSDVEIKNFTITNVKAFGGMCSWDGLKVGKLTVINSRIGTGDGIDIKDFGFGSSVEIKNLTTTNNVEDEVDIR